MHTWGLFLYAKIRASVLSDGAPILCRLSPKVEVLPVSHHVEE